MSVVLSSDYMPGGRFFTGYRIDQENIAEIEEQSDSFDVAYGDFEPPEEIDPRKLVRHDKQLVMGSCRGFSGANCGEYLWALHLGLENYQNDHQFSSLFFYLETQRLDGWLGRDNGSTISRGIKLAKEVGYLEEKYLPYPKPAFVNQKLYPSNARSLVTPTMRERAGRFKIESSSLLKSYDGVFRYLASRRGPVDCGAPWNNSFYAKNGVLNSINFGVRDGGHAYCFLGYSRRKDSRGRNYLWRLNSHHDSYVEVAPSVIDKLVSHPHSVFVGVSDLKTPGPRRVDFSKSTGIT